MTEKTTVSLTDVAAAEREQFISLESLVNEKPRFGAKIIIDGYYYFTEHSFEELEAILMGHSKQDFIKVYENKTYALRYLNMRTIKYMDIQFEFPVGEGIPFAEYLKTSLQEQ